MVEQLPHQHEQRHGDEDKIPSVFPGYQRRVRRRRRSALDDPQPDDPGKGHRKADGDANDKEHEQQDHAGDAGQHQIHRPDPVSPSSGAAEGLTTRRAMSTSPQMPTKAMNGHSATLRSSPVSPVMNM